MFSFDETIAVDSPVAALDVLTAREGAAAFRDITRYDSYEVRDDGIHVTYRSGIPLTAPVSMTIRPRGARIDFYGRGPLGMQTSGAWTVAPNGIARLQQNVVALPVLEPFVRRRVARALADLQRAAAR